MRTYETIFILKPTLSADEHTKHIDFYKDNIVKHGGEVIKCDVWGKQQMAYVIDNFSEGFYVLIQFKAEHNYTGEELEKRFKFNEDVIRYVVVMLDEKKFKINPRKDPVRREKPAGDKAKRSEEEFSDFSELIEKESTDSSDDIKSEDK